MPLIGAVTIPTATRVPNSALLAGTTTPGGPSPLSSNLGQVLLIPPLLGLQAYLANRAEKLPKIKPGDLVKVAVQIKEIQTRGGIPRITTDPYTGNVLIYEASQDPFAIRETQVQREAATPGPDYANQIYQLRQQLIEALARPKVSSPTATPRRADIPVSAQQRATRRFVGAGRVSKGNLVSDQMLAGPCAGVVSGLQKIRCNRGGFV
jgi:ribosomal protein L19